MTRTRTALLAALATAVLPGAAMAAAEQLYMDPNHTQIRATWMHFSGVPLEIRWTRFDSTVMYDSADPAKSSIDITVPIDSIYTGVDPFAEHLQSADFFDAGKFPTAHFKSTSFEKTGDNTAKMTGDLTLKDHTAPVTFDVTLVGEADAMGRHLMGFTAKTTLTRSEWGLGMYAPAVADKIDLVIASEMSATPPQ